MNSELIGKVSKILREVASETIVPAFRQDVGTAGWEKSPGEVVTEVDRQTEQRISRELRGLLPGSLVIGEEGCSDDPDLLKRLAEPRVWLLDPLDGTHNFAAGRPPFAVMLALLANAQPVAAWILDPMGGELTAAERGSGAWRGDERLHCRQTATALGQATGIVSNAFVPEVRSPWVEALTTRLGDARPTRRCAGAEYPLLASGEVDLLVYWRTLPWDHAAGTLLVEEAGGSVRQIDGAPFDLSRPRPGLVSAANAELLDALLALPFPAAQR